MVEKPWGSYKVLVDSELYKIKEITVNPNSSLSLQSHENRAETWIVISGIAQVQVGKDYKFLKSQDKVFIPAGTKHRLTNSTKDQLVIVEIQTGESFDEEDIVRYEDEYGRVIKN
jgi:mannose-6-phosphate isomerase-like protein (cupin superfamily)